MVRCIIHRGISRGRYSRIPSMMQDDVRTKRWIHPILCICAELRSEMIHCQDGPKMPRYYVKEGYFLFNQVVSLMEVGCWRSEVVVL